MKNQIDQLAYFVAFAVVNDRQTVIDLLHNNNIPVDINHVSDEKLVSTVINGLYSSEKLRKDFSNYISEITNNLKFSSADGGFWSGFNASAVSSLVGTGLGFLASTQSSNDQKNAAQAQANANLALAQATKESNATQLEIAKLQLEAAKSKPQTNNTVLYAVLGVSGALVLGFVIFAVTRPKK